MLKFKNVCDKIAFIMAIVAGCSCLAMMFLITGDVLCRNLLHTIIPGTYAITMYILMPLAFFPGLPLAYISGVIPKIVNVFARWKIGKFISELSVFVLEVIIFVWLIRYSIVYMMNGFSQEMATDMQGKIVPIYPVFIVIPIGFAVTFVCIIAYYFAQFKKKGASEPEAAVEKKEA